MCFMLYLSSDQKLSLTLWTKENPKVAISEPRTTIKHFSKKNIYYVNSSECCGCGFRQESDLLYPDSSELESTSKNQAQLYENLSHFLANEDFVELFGCWTGGEDKLEKSREIKIKELLKDDFYFAENELIIVKK